MQVEDSDIDYATIPLESINQSAASGAGGGLTSSGGISSGGSTTKMSGSSGVRSMSTLTHRRASTAAGAGTRQEMRADERARVSDSNNATVPPMGSSDVNALPESEQDAAKFETATGAGTMYSATKANPARAQATDPAQFAGPGTARTSSTAEVYDPDKRSESLASKPAAQSGPLGHGTINATARRGVHTSAGLFASRTGVLSNVPAYGGSQTSTSGSAEARGQSEGTYMRLPEERCPL